MNEDFDLESLLESEITTAAAAAAEKIAKNMSETESEEKKPRFKVFKTPKIRKPIMSREVEQSVLNAIIQFREVNKWESWGLDDLREQGAAVLLEGPSGCGKTVIAKWMAKLCKHGWMPFNVSNVSGGDPGETEKYISALFDEAEERNNRTIFLDECDHILRRRSDMSGDALTWMVGTAETILVRIGIYPGLCILASNFADVLDPALDRRLLARIHVGRPNYEMRLQLWKDKIPRRFPFQPTINDLEELANHDLSGAQIETVIINSASDCIRNKKRPTMKSMQQFCIRETDRFATVAK